jgi:hypothetical protein
MLLEFFWQILHLRWVLAQTAVLVLTLILAVDQAVASMQPREYRMLSEDQERVMQSLLVALVVRVLAAVLEPC